MLAHEIEGVQCLSLREVYCIDLKFKFFSFCYIDERRMRVVEIGGAQELINMLGGAKDDRTRKEALRALAALSYSGDIFIFELSRFCFACHFAAILLTVWK